MACARHNASSGHDITVPIIETSAIERLKQERFTEGLRY
jgi:hypothetical protein